MLLPYLTDDEIAHLCAPLTQPAAQVRYLRRAGFAVIERPNGRPFVSRSNYDQVTAGAVLQPAAQSTRTKPDRGALLRVIRGGVESAA